MIGPERRGSVSDSLPANDAPDTALRADAAAFRAIARHPAQIVLFVTADAVVRYVSPAIEAMLGRRAEQIIGTVSLDFVHPDDRAAMLETLTALVHGGDVARVEARVAHADGSWRVVEFLGANHLDDVHLGAVVVSARDITERRREQEELRDQFRAAEEARGQARALLDAATEAMILFSTAGRVLGYNRRFAQFFVLTERELEGAPLDAVYPCFTRAFGPAVAVERLAVYLEQSGQVALDSADVHQIWPYERDLRLTVVPVRTAEGAYLGALLAFLDVSAERQAARLRDEFVSFVSHDLRTPLTSIGGFVDLLLEGEGGDLSVVQREFLDIIKRNVDREVALVNDLLDLSRLDAGKLDLKLVPLQVASLLRDVARSLAPQIDTKRQQLDVRIPNDLPAIEGDVVRLSQVFTNLLSNAQKYTAPGGQITLSARVANEQLYVEVTDTGVGLTMEEQARLFTKFYRAGNAATVASGGTGLGLVISRALVEKHGGRITVKSAPGEGSTFAVVLPVHTAFSAHLSLPAAT